MTYAKTIEKTFVAFHVGRGGHYWNAGHRSFIDQDRQIGDFCDDLFAAYENEDDIYIKIKGRENLEEKYALASDRDESALAFFEKIGLPFGELAYYDGAGNAVGLLVEQAETGLGVIDIDGDYDTTYVCHLEDCDDNELQLIFKSDAYVSNEVREYCRAILVEKKIISEDESL